MQEMQVPSLGGEDPLKELMATHSSILAEIPHGHRTLVSYSPKGHSQTVLSTHWIQLLNLSKSWLFFYIPEFYFISHVYHFLLESDIWK